MNDEHAKMFVIFTFTLIDAYLVKRNSSYRDFAARKQLVRKLFSSCS